MNYTRFMTADNSRAGERTVVLNGSVTGKVDGGGYGEPVTVNSGVIPLACIGKTLWVEFSGTSGDNQYCRVDDVRLIVIHKKELLFAVGGFHQTAIQSPIGGCA